MAYMLHILSELDILYRHGLGGWYSGCSSTWGDSTGHRGTLGTINNVHNNVLRFYHRGGSHGVRSREGQHITGWCNDGRGSVKAPHVRVTVLGTRDTYKNAGHSTISAKKWKNNAFRGQFPDNFQYPNENMESVE